MFTKGTSLVHKQLFLWPVVIPLLSEGDLDTKLHPYVINFLETPDEEIDPDEAGPVTVWARVPPVARVHRLSLGLFSIDKSSDNTDGFGECPNDAIL